MKWNKKDIHESIYYYAFAALALVIPLHDKLVPVCILIISLNWIAEWNFRKKMNRIKNSRNSKWLLGFTLIYFLYLIGTLYSSQLYGQSGALFDIEVKLSLLLFPLFFSTIDFGSFKKGFYSRIRYNFILGCIISALIVLNNAVFQYFTTHDHTVFYYTSLSMWHHPSYLALYFNLGIAFLITWLIPNWKKNAQKRFIALVSILFFQVFIALLSSKAGILSLFLTYFLVIVFYLLHDWKRSGLQVILALSLSISFILTLVMFPYSFKRFDAAAKAVTENNEIHSPKIEGSVARMVVWQCSIDIIKEHPLFGVGTGDVKLELMKKYREKDIERAIQEHLNAHNQFLQTLIALGIVGFIVLAAMLILPFILAFRRKNLLYSIFIAVFVLNLLVESMLERQGGVVFYAFFNAFLFYYTTLNESTKLKKAD